MSLSRRGDESVSAANERFHICHFGQHISTDVDTIRAHDGVHGRVLLTSKLRNLRCLSSTMTSLLSSNRGKGHKRSTTTRSPFPTASSPGLSFSATSTSAARGRRTLEDDFEEMATRPLPDAHRGRGTLYGVMLGHSAARSRACLSDSPVSDGRRSQGPTHARRSHLRELTDDTNPRGRRDLQQGDRVYCFNLRMLDASLRHQWVSALPLFLKPWGHHVCSDNVNDVAPRRRPVAPTLRVVLRSCRSPCRSSCPGERRRRCPMRSPRSDRREELLFAPTLECHT